MRPIVVARRVTQRGEKQHEKEEMQESESWVTSRVVCKIDYGAQTPVLIQVMEYGKDYSL